MNLFAVLLLSFAMLIWGSSFIAMKIALLDMGSSTVLFLRMLIASTCFLYFIKSFLKFNFTKENIRLLVLLAFFEPCLYFIFEAEALKLTTASQAGTISALCPIIVGFLAGYFLKEKITKKLLIGALIAFGGTVLLSMSSDTSSYAPNPILGNFFELLAMLCAAGYTITAKHLSKEFSALFITAFQVFIGAIFFLPMFIYEISTQTISFSQNALLAIAYLGVVVTLGGYGLYNYGLTKIDASKTAVFIYLIPIFAMILAYFILDEKITLLNIFASLIILIGVFISEFPIDKFLKKKRIQ